MRARPAATTVPDASGNEAEQADQGVTVQRILVGYAHRVFGVSRAWYMT